MIEGVRVGHWTGEGTGCTVVVFPPGTIGSGEVRGGAPATREFALLDPTRNVEVIDAVVMSGGSAFGLATADGVMRALRNDDRGFETSAGRVPIVPAMGLFDLRPDAFSPPGPAEGRLAYESAAAAFDTGVIGAGTGARTGRWRGPDENGPGGLGFASLAHDGLVVSALAAVNSVGEPGVVDSELIARNWTAEPPPLENTTLILIATNAQLTKVQCHLVAQSGHDGIGRALFPAHTRSDGDAVVAAATGVVEAHPEKVRSLAVLAVQQAIEGVVA
jgi:L-aminopeptidase/D-esterase-like protein